jgi:hypothetical protein
MATEKTTESPFADTGDDALANQIRNLVRELNLALGEARSRNINVTLVQQRAVGFGHNYKVEKIAVERPL